MVLVPLIWNGKREAEPGEAVPVRAISKESHDAQIFPDRDQSAATHQPGPQGFKRSGTGRQPAAKPPVEAGGKVVAQHSQRAPIDRCRMPNSHGPHPSWTPRPQRKETENEC